MFKSSRRGFKPTVYKSSRQRRRRGMPRWAVILFTGVIIGAGGFWFLQTNYGPTRITVEESQRLSQQINALTQEQYALQHRADELSQSVQQLQAENSRLQTQHERDLQQLQTQQEEVELVRRAIPRDPNNTPVGLRHAELSAELGKLHYDLLLMKSDRDQADYEVIIEANIEGRYRNGNRGIANPEPFSTTVGNLTQVQGELVYAEAQRTLTATRVTFTVKNASDNTVLGRRTFNVN